MKLAAVLACRNQSSRLYGKPLQNLDTKNQVSILDYIVAQLKKRPEINDIIFAISEQEENIMYQSIAKNYGIPFVIGDDSDVLARLIKGADCVSAKHIFRVTTESPYTYLDNLKDIALYHVEKNMDYTGLKGLPDGAYYEIISLEALKKSWNEGSERHRSELCDLYILENMDKFKVVLHEAPVYLRRRDIRLTVDWPEDLIVMRAIYEGLKLSPQEPLNFKKIIEFLDKNPIINSINNWIDSGSGKVPY